MSAETKGNCRPLIFDREERYKGQQKRAYTLDLYDGEHEAFEQCWREYLFGDKFGQRQALRQADQDQGVRSLEHLVHVVMVTGFTAGQSYIVARALASMYNGDRVKADLFDWRGLDLDLVEHLIHVIRLHTCNQGYREIHTFLNGRPGQPGGNEIFERMIKAYGLEKRRRKA